MSRISYFAKFFCQFCAWCVFCSALEANLEGGVVRAWKNVDGRKIQAVLRGVKEDRIILFKDGREYVFPLSRLSERDREFVIKHRQEKQAGVLLTSVSKDFPYLTDKELAIAPKISVDLLEKTVLFLTNEFRKTLKVSELKEMREVSVIARTHSRDMQVRGFFSHDNPDGESPTDRAQKADFSGFGKNPDGKTRYGLSENIGRVGRYSSIQQSKRNGKVVGRKVSWQSEDQLARQIVQGFIDSPDHKKNLLDPTKAYIGVGIHIYREHIFVTQNFF
ncbi:MAG: CAP domain-containing protein [Verrucomicrobiota bacterium]|nr:CAP domain-containing protein [Verrucomicrobiota bacterium]